MPSHDAAQITRLYRRFGPVIYARCRRILRDATAAEDAVQEVFLRGCRSAPVFATEQDGLRWLYRVSTNYCLNVLRARKPSVPEERAAGLAQEPGLEHSVLSKDLAARLLARMPRQLQEVAVLYHVDDLEQAEVARILGVSRRTVITRLQRFEQRAQRLLPSLGGAASGVGPGPGPAMTASASREDDLHTIVPSVVDQGGDG